MSEGVFPIGDAADYEISSYTPMRVQEKLRNKTGWGIDILTADRDRMSKRTLRGNYRPVMVHYPVTEFTVSKNERTLDLIKLLPEGWKWDAVRSASPEAMPPEILDIFSHHLEIDIDGRTLEVGTLDPEEASDPSTHTLETTAKILLWNVLFAQAVGVMGLPGNDEAAIAIRDVVLERREQVLQAFDLPGGDPSRTASVPLTQ